MEKVKIFDLNKGDYIDNNLYTLKEAKEKSKNINFPAFHHYSIIDKEINKVVGGFNKYDLEMYKNNFSKSKFEFKKINQNQK